MGGGVVVPVDHLLLMLAEKHEFQPVKVLVTREKGNSPQQMRRYGRIPTRESIVIFRKPKSLFRLARNPKRILNN